MSEPNSGEAKVPQTFEEWRHAAQSKQHPFNAEFHMTNCPATCRNCRDAWDAATRAQAARDAEKDAEIRQLVGASDRCAFRLERTGDPCGFLAAAHSSEPEHLNRVKNEGDALYTVHGHAFRPESTLDAVRRYVADLKRDADVLRNHITSVAVMLGAGDGDGLDENAARRVVAHQLTDSARDRAAKRITSYFLPNRGQVAIRHDEEERDVAAIIDEERRR